MRLLYKLRKLIWIILAIGLPIFIYFGFIRKTPVFEPEYDVEIGRQSVYSIQQDSVENPLLSMEEYPEAYAYMQDMVNELTSAKAVQYADIFKYDSVRIIHRDDVLNAFCTPGGYVYVYTGLIHYLDHPDHLAGVLGHEIAHAERRHSAVRLQKEFGRQRILDFILVGGAGLGEFVKASVLAKMLTLNYSRDQEAEADEYSVLYLQDTKYACNGTGGFFKKLVDAGEDVNIPEFLSDHPDSKARIRDIDAKADEIGCSTRLANASGWEDFKSLLPKPVDKEDTEEEIEADPEAVEAEAKAAAEGSGEVGNN